MPLRGWLQALGDTQGLATRDLALLGLSTRYNGFVDRAVEGQSRGI